MISIPDPYAIDNVPGNRALVFLVNSADEVAYSAFRLGVLPALNHFGFPFRLLDLATVEELPNLGVESAGVVFAHDGVGGALSLAQSSAIVDAVASGLGIASFDGRLWQSIPEVQQLFGLADLVSVKAASIKADRRDHYVTEMQEDFVHEFRIPIAASCPGSISERFTSLASDESGRSLAVAGSRLLCGGGHRVALLFSPELWLRENFGHCMGLDDLFWRALVWIAKKPFPILKMPQFAVCRVDDAIGSHDHFGYVDTLNEFNWISNIGVFMDDIDDLGIQAMKRHYDSGAAEFSVHSFHEIGEPFPDQTYMQHDGTEYTLDELKAIFERIDNFYERVGISPSHTVNIHYDEVGINSLPFLAARDQLFTMDQIPYGVKWYANSYSWEPYPYGHQSMHYAPMHPDLRFWDVEGHFLSSYKTPDAWMSPGEFMWGHTVFADESPETNIPKAVEAGTRAVKAGISSGFFGTLMCHEQRIQAVTAAEWREIISGISEKLAGWEILYRGYDEIAQFAKDKARTRISMAEYNEKEDKLTATLDGTCDAYLSCHVFWDYEERCVFDLVDTPAFDGTFDFE
ncbi:MAG TPA: hypothetical protein VGK34_10345 [Armatimonadota bacterium]